MEARVRERDLWASSSVDPDADALEHAQEEAAVEEPLRLE
jgi:hypothetical protein